MHLHITHTFCNRPVHTVVDQNENYFITKLRFAIALLRNENARQFDDVHQAKLVRKRTHTHRTQYI